MTIPSDCIWEVRAGGSDTLCGSGFSVANKGATGVDYTVQDAAQYTYTANLSASGTATLTGVGFTNDILGNVMQITGQGSYCVTAFTSSTTVTVDRALGTFSGATGYIGGGFASPGKVGGIAASSNIVFQKAGTYTIGNGTLNTSGQNVSTNGVSWCGYSTNRFFGNTDTRPVWDAAANNQNPMVLAGTPVCFDNIEFTNSTSKTGLKAITTQGNAGIIRRCKMTGYATTLNYQDQGTRTIECYFSGCGGPAVSGSGHQFIRCVSVNSTGADFSGGNAYVFVDCIVITPVLTGIIVGSDGLALNCDVYSTSSTQQAISLNSNGGSAQGCVVWGNGGTSKGIAMTSGNYSCLVQNCAVGNCGTNYDANLQAYQKVNCVTLTADPWTAKGSNDFSLNNTAGGGAACRASGIPGTFVELSTTGYRDIGAWQGSDAGAAGGCPHLAGRGGGLAG